LLRQLLMKSLRWLFNRNVTGSGPTREANPFQTSTTAFRVCDEKADQGSRKRNVFSDSASGKVLNLFRGIHRSSGDGFGEFASPVHGDHYPCKLFDILYQLAFLQNDRPGMAQQAVWSAGKSDWEGWLDGWFLVQEANTSAYSGQLKKARTFFPPRLCLLRACGRRRDGGRIQSGCSAAGGPLRQRIRGSATGCGGSLALEQTGAVSHSSGIGTGRGHSSGACIAG
jgi:hypothetical protein